MKELRRQKFWTFLDGKKVHRVCEYCFAAHIRYISTASVAIPQYCKRYTWRGIVGNIKRLIKEKL